VIVDLYAIHYPVEQRYGHPKTVAKQLRREQCLVVLEIVVEDHVVAAFSFAVQDYRAPRQGPPVHGDLRDIVLVDDQRNLHEKVIVGLLAENMSM
jgi:hypothetical protein